MGNEIALRPGGDLNIFQPKYPARQVRKRETHTFRDAQIIFRNFAGNPTTFKPEGGVRGFSILLDEELALYLIDQGLNVNPLRKQDEDDEQMYHLPVAVSYKIRPPRIYMVTGDGERLPLRKQLLPEDMIHMLDGLELGEAHMTIAVSNYEVRGTKGKKAYLQSFFGHILMDELEEEYATVEDMIEVDRQKFAAEDIIEGEIVED